MFSMKDDFWWKGILHCTSCVQLNLYRQIKTWYFLSYNNTWIRLVINYQTLCKHNFWTKSDSNPHLTVFPDFCLSLWITILTSALTILKSYMASVSESSLWGGTWKYSMSFFSSISTFSSKFAPLSEMRSLNFWTVSLRCTWTNCGFESRIWME